MIHLFAHGREVRWRAVDYSPGAQLTACETKIEDFIVLQIYSAVWRLQDIVLLRGLYARINHLDIAPLPPALRTRLHYYCTTIAQLTTPLRAPLCSPCTIQYRAWQHRVKANLRDRNRGFV